jgi:hypothetical protein
MNDNMQSDTAPGNDVTDEDDNKLFADLAMPAERQIIWLGLTVAVLIFFGSTLWEFIIG